LRMNEPDTGKLPFDRREGRRDHKIFESQHV
jgi:hypothetical protein